MRRSNETETSSTINKSGTGSPILLKEVERVALCYYAL